MAWAPPNRVVPRSEARSAARVPSPAFLAVVALTAVAAGLRFSTLGAQSFWADEAAVAEFTGVGFGEIYDSLAQDVNAPFYYVVIWGWAKVFGSSEVGLRSLSAALGTATVPIAFAVGSALITRRAGLALAALTAVSPLLIWYSQEARSY